MWLLDMLFGSSDDSTDEVYGGDDGYDGADWEDDFDGYDEDEF
jgi:hypothetical protein